MAKTTRRTSYRKAKRWNPSRGRKRGGSRFTKHRSGRKWESAVSGSMPHWANPRKGYTQDAVQVLFDEGKQFLSEGEIGQCKDVIGELDEHGPEGRKAGQALAKRMGKMGHTYKKYRSSRPSTVAMLSRWQDEDRGVLSEMRSNPRGHRGSRRKNRRHFSVHETTGTSGRFRTRRGRHQVSKAYKKRGYIHGRRNPDVNGNAGKAHPAYGQYLMKLGFGMNDPIVELGAAWARGEAGGSRLIQQAIISAERSMENRDRRVAQNAKNVANKLRSYLKEQERHEGYRHKSGFKAGTLVGAARFANPRRRKARR